MSPSLLLVAALSAAAADGPTKRIEHGEKSPLLEYPCKRGPDPEKKGPKRWSCDGVEASPAALKALGSAREKRLGAQEAIDALVGSAHGLKGVPPAAVAKLRAARAKVEATTQRLRSRVLRSDAEVLAAVKAAEAGYDAATELMKAAASGLALAESKGAPKKDGKKGKDGKLGAPDADRIKLADEDPGRIPGNSVFDGPGMFIANASAYPPSLYAAKLKAMGVTWVSLQIHNPGPVAGNVAELEKGWAEEFRKAGIQVGFWGVSYGNAAEDARVAAQLSAKYKGDFYIADCEGSFQAGEGDPARNRAFVEAFQAEAARLGIGKLPRALSSMGRVALDHKPWIDGGWDALPQTYWNDWTVYQPSANVKYWEDAGWPKGRIHPTIATYDATGDQKAKISLEDYFEDLQKAGTKGFSYYLPESYLDDEGYRKLGEAISTGRISGGSGDEDDPFGGSGPAEPSPAGGPVRATTDTERRVCAADGDPACSESEGAEVVRRGEAYARRRLEELRRVACLVPGLELSTAADPRRAWRESSASFVGVCKAKGLGDPAAFLRFLRRHRRENGCRPLAQ